jgi:protein-disulfide isomerase
MVIFSDPQCPFSIQFVPQAIKDFKEKKGDIALYYYHMPLLRLHPVSEVLTRVMEVLQKEGKKELAMKVYGLKIAAREKKEDKILAALKNQLNIEVSKEAIAKKEIKEAVKKDMAAATDMMVRGTPTVYFDGVFDESREKYKQFLK